MVLLATISKHISFLSRVMLLLLILEVRIQSLNEQFQIDLLAFGFLIKFVIFKYLAELIITPTIKVIINISCQNMVESCRNIQKLRFWIPVEILRLLEPRLGFEARPKIIAMLTSFSSNITIFGKIDFSDLYIFGFVFLLALIVVLAEHVDLFTIIKQ